MTWFIRWKQIFRVYNTYRYIIYISFTSYFSSGKKGNYFGTIRGKATTFRQIVYNIHWFSSAMCRLLKENQGLFSDLFSEDCYNSLKVVLNIKWKCLAPDMPNSQDHDILCFKWVTMTFDTEKNHSSESTVQMMESYWGERTPSWPPWESSSNYWN